MKRFAIFLCAVLLTVFTVACARQDDGVDVSISTSYTISFVQDGYETVEITVEKGEDVSIPAIRATAPEGYSYQWERTDFSNVSEDITVRLKAVPNVYVVYYDVGDYVFTEIENESQEVAYGETFLPLIPTRAGYTFLGWKRENEDGYFAPKKYTLLSDVYLTAVWEVDLDSDFWFTPDL